MTDRIRIHPTGDGGQLELDLSVEDDNGLYLAVTGYHGLTNSQAFDYVITDDIENFFAVVERARVEYVRLKIDRDTTAND